MEEVQPNADLARMSEERWRQKILAETGLLYRALSAGPVAWQALEASFRGLERMSWQARTGYPPPTTTV